MKENKSRLVKGASPNEGEKLEEAKKQKNKIMDKIIDQLMSIRDVMQSAIYQVRYENYSQAEKFVKEGVEIANDVISKLEDLEKQEG